MRPPGLDVQGVWPRRLHMAPYGKTFPGQECCHKAWAVQHASVTALHAAFRRKPTLATNAGTRPGLRKVSCSTALHAVIRRKHSLANSAVTRPSLRKARPTKYGLPPYEERPMGQECGDTACTAYGSAKAAVHAAVRRKPRWPRMRSQDLGCAGRIQRGEAYGNRLPYGENSSSREACLGVWQLEPATVWPKACWVLMAVFKAIRRQPLAV